MMSLAVGLFCFAPLHAGAGPQAKQTSKPKPKKRKKVRKRRAAKKIPLRSVVMKKRKTLHPIPKPADLAPPKKPPNDPWAGYPDLPRPTPDGVTSDRFPVSYQQLLTPHGFADVKGQMFNNDYYAGILLDPTKEDRLRIYVDETWMEGHDLDIECWGQFTGGKVRVTASGYDGYNGPYVAVGSVEVEPPAGQPGGRIKVAVPTAGVNLKHFNLEVADADGQGDAHFLHQCIVERD